jgi:putative transcriptional regulator
MAITIKLDNLLYERRITLTELAERIDISLANLSILKTGKARAIRFSTLEAICRELSCQPGDILQFEPEQAELVQLALSRQAKSDKGRDVEVKDEAVN